MASEKPDNTHHYLWTTDQEVVLQVSVMGRFIMTFVKTGRATLDAPELSDCSGPRTSRAESYACDDKTQVRSTIRKAASRRSVAGNVKRLSLGVMARPTADPRNSPWAFDTTFR